MRRLISIAAGALILVSCADSEESAQSLTSQSFIGTESSRPGSDADPASTIASSSTTQPNDGIPNTRTGHVVLDGVSGGSERCNMDTDRRVSVDWLAPPDGYLGPPLPLFMYFTGASGGYTSPYDFEPWENIGLRGKDNLDDAFNIVVRFECMNDPNFGNLSTGPQMAFFLAELGWNPHDVNYVYELLCTEIHKDSPDAAKIAPIDERMIDCTRVGLSGTSGGGFTAQMFVNECFEEMTITPNIKAIASVVAGFWPFGSCTISGRTGFEWRFEDGIPLFMKVACSDQRSPYNSYGRDQWPKLAAPKYLYSRTGGHFDFEAPGGSVGSTASLISGEDLIRAFMRYHLLQDEGPTGLGALDDYPDRPELRRPEGFQTSYQYDGPIGTRLDGGIC